MTDNRIFVYKIIHDLRHPTEALANELKNMLKNLIIKKSLSSPQLINKKASFNSMVILSNDDKQKKYNNAIKNLKIYLKQN